MKISVVITTKNEEKHIENCLKSVKNQDFSGEIEIIVVDNGSGDKTKEIARKYTELVFDIGPERSVQRNFGVKKSSASWFIFLDADMLLSEKVLSECAEKARNDSRLAGLYIPEIILGNSLFNKVRNFERSFYNAGEIDGVRFIKKSAFDETGGFDEELYAGEDWDLTRRLKKVGSTDIINAPIYHNETDINLKKYLTKKAYYAGNVARYVTKWGKTDGAVRKQLGLYYRFVRVFFENKKWKKALRHPILMAGVYMLKILLGFIYIFNTKNERK